jgi:hypothetical protein
MATKGKWPGEWKVICDVCGFEFPSGSVRKRWDGLIVCDDDWESRHPQTLYNYKHHTSVPDPIRAEPPDVFVHVCTIISASGYAGLATAGCAQAGNTQFSYSFLLDFFLNGHES